MTNVDSAITREERERALSVLREAILSLKSTGHEGFEGLLASILSAYTNQPVRLFRSGYQFGQDSASSSPDTILSIEAKQYSKSISNGTILEKVPQFMDQVSPPDLWIAGASCGTNPSLEKTLRSVSKQTGIACFILDWPENSEAPPLAAYCMLAPETTQSFLDEQADAEETKTAIAEALETLSHCESLRAYANKLAIEFTAPSIGLSLAKEANAEWLKEKLSSQERARAAFGQRLAPAAKSAVPFQNRNRLNSEIGRCVFGAEPSDPVFIVGKQGFGKSWAVMSAWLADDAPPLLLTLTANKAAEFENATDISEALAREFLVQTGAVFPELALPRWMRRLSRWRLAPKPEQPRYIVLLDGLNQRADADWTTIVSKFQEFVSSTGGQLAVTVRTPLYERFKYRLPLHQKPISVTAWTKPEIRSILTGADINIEELPAAVVNELIVPRLCAIAFELLSTNRIKDFQDLTVSKLLYAQIQSGEGIALDSNDFAKDIEHHAKDTLDRMLKQQTDPELFEDSDTKRFAIHSRLELLSQDGFFKLDPFGKSDYSILPSALSLGLALSIVRQLQRGATDTSAMQSQCADLLEPIEAIDQTAEIVLDALILAAADEACSDLVVKTLIHAFTALQNVDIELHPAFSFAARLRPAPLLAALEASVKDGSRDHNTDWLISSAASFSSDPEAKLLLETSLEHWLNQYSLAPKLGAFGRSPGGPTTAEIDKQKGDIDEAMSEFSAYESDMLSQMSRNDAEVPYDLIETAITLLKTLDRTPFIPSLSRYVLARTVNSPWHHSNDDFNALIRFNFRDWRSAREAIVSQVDRMETAKPSKTGKWTMVILLEATGDPDDFARATTLRAELELESIKQMRAEHAKRRNYFPSDPDEVVDIDHLDEVRDRLTEIDLENWRIDRGNTPTNHLIEENLPYLARFALDESVSLQRGLIDEMLSRSELALKMAVFELQSESFVATPDQRDKMIAKSLSLEVQHENKANDEDWITQQLLLLMGLADRDGNEQLESICQLPGDATLLLKFDHVMRRPNDQLIAEELANAIEDGTQNRIVRALLFTNSLGESFSNSLRANCEALLDHASTIVRAYAMRALITLNDPNILSRFANSHWSASKLHPKRNFYERWFGAQLLIAAAREGKLGYQELLSRITSRHYAGALASLGNEVTPHILEVLDRAFEVQLNNEDEEPPVIKAPFVSPSDLDPQRVSLEERETSSDDPINVLREHSETNQGFRERQKSQSDAYGVFLDKLSEKNAADLLGDIGYSTIQACTELAPERVTAWANRVLNASGWKRRALKPVGLHIAQALAEIEPDVSYPLYSKLLKTDGFVKFHTGSAKIDHDAIALWFGASIDKVRDECFGRLDNCADDERIHLEVLAALHAQRADLLKAYCDNRLASKHPMKVCRGLIVAATANIAAIEIDQLLGTPGPIGTAAKKAADIQRDWNSMRHWWDALCNAQSEEAFWQASLLLRKCVDARYDLLEDKIESDSVAKRNLPFIEQEISKAIEGAEKQLSNTLFGDRLSNSWFVEIL